MSTAALTIQLGPFPASITVQGTHYNSFLHIVSFFSPDKFSISYNLFQIYMHYFRRMKIIPSFQPFLLMISTMIWSILQYVDMTTNSFPRNSGFRAVVSVMQIWVKIDKEKDTNHTFSNIHATRYKTSNVSTLVRVQHSLELS